MNDSLATGVFAVVFLLAVLWAAFWLIRLAVRYGVDDALRKHREITRRERDGERPTQRVD